MLEQDNHTICMVLERNCAWYSTLKAAVIAVKIAAEL
jgi:hypothetical protein